MKESNQSHKRLPLTKPKFASLSPLQQHKYCCQLLKDCYIYLDPNKIDHYHELMGFTYLKNQDRKEISDRYHIHLKECGVGIKEHGLLPHVITGDRSEPKHETLPVAIYLDNLRSAHNVGSIIRTTEAFRLGRLHFSPDTPFIDNKQVSDAAMGAEKWIECFRSATLDDLPRPLIALETCEGAVDIHSYLFPESFTLVVGNEEYGCRESTLRAADILVKIPLRGRKNSLNVANAFAIAAAVIQAKSVENNL